MKTIKKRLKDLWGIFKIGFWYIKIPVRWDDYPDKNPEDAFSRYEFRTFYLKSDNPSDWEPKRPCYYKWKYDGRPQYVLAGCGLQMGIGYWSEDKEL